MRLVSIRRFVGGEIFSRGLAYFRNGHVKSFVLKDNLITARVRGQYEREYRVAIELTSKGIRRAACTCPYYALCKHVAAVLIHYVKNELAALGETENPLKFLSGKSAEKKIPLSFDSGARDSLDSFLSDIDPARFIYTRRPAGQHWRLAFLVSTGAAASGILSKERWTIEPALLYLKRDNTTGRIAAFRRELLTERMSEDELSLLAPLLFLPDQRDNLSRAFPLLLHSPRMSVFLRHRNMTVPLAFHEIGRVTVSFSIQAIRGPDVIFTPRFQCTAADKLFPKEELKPSDTYADAGRLIIFSKAHQSAFFYEKSPLTVALLTRLIFTQPRFTPADIDALRSYILEKRQDDITIDFPVREILLRRVPPLPVVEIEEIDRSGLLSLALFFTYGESEVRLGDRERFLRIREGETLEVALRDTEREEQTMRFLSRLLQDASGAVFDTDLKEHIELRATDAQDFLETHARRLFDEGFHIRMKDNHEKIVPRKGRLSVSLVSGIDWFQFRAAYTGEDGNKIDVTFDRELFRRRLLKTGDHYIYLSPEDIGSLARLFNDGMDREGNLTTSKLNLSLIADIKDVLTDEDDPEIRHAEKLFEKLSRFDTIDPVPLPRGLAGKLRPYQAAGFSWLSFLHAYDLGGCLADDMGLGKTVQTLALLQSLKEKESLRTSLLVVPLTTIANWENEIRRWTPEMSYLRHMGQGRKKDMDFHYRHDLVITSYHTLKNDIEYFSRVPFDYCILDESQNIKNAGSQVFKAVRKLVCRHRLSLTGTPVENSTLELWAQMEFLNPGLLGTQGDFRERFARPIEREADQEKSKLLRARVFPFILRRKKEDVLTELPPKEEIPVILELGDRQKALYDRLRAEAAAAISRAIDERGVARIGIEFFQALLRLRQCALIPALIDDRFRAIESAKLDMLGGMIDDIVAEGHKVLVFSQFVGALKSIETLIGKKGYPYAYLDGSTKDRGGEIERFRENPEVRIFLLSLKAGGIGINLTEADYVILFDPWWNPAVEAQAVDRAHRMGRTKKVTVYRLLTKDTVEERIEELKKKKQALVAELITPEAGLLKALTREDVMNILG